MTKERRITLPLMAMQYYHPLETWKESWNPVCIWSPTFKKAPSSSYNPPINFLCICILVVGDGASYTVVASENVTGNFQLLQLLETRYICIQSCSLVVHAGGKVGWKVVYNALIEIFWLATLIKYVVSVEEIVMFQC